MKRVIVIYHSQFGNTERIAKALADGIRGQGIEVDCFAVDKVSFDNLATYDLFAVGGPTHKFGLSDPMKDFLEKLKTVDLRGKKAFAFDTKMKPWIAGSAAKKIEKNLKGLGMSIAKPHYSAIVQGREGPLEEGIEEKFRQIGAEIAKLLE
jgi:flavodoxin